MHTSIATTKWYFALATLSIDEQLIGRERRKALESAHAKRQVLEKLDYLGRDDHQRLNSARDRRDAAHTLFEQRAANLEWSPAHVAKVHFHSDALRESLGEEQLVAQAEPAAFAIAAQVVPHIEV